MVSERHASRVTMAISVVVIVAAIVIGTRLRLKDPMSSEMLTAEDPFTHMAYVREHLRDGAFDPMNPGGALYPPGMHALLAAIYVFTGFELYEIIRLGAVGFGTLSILGIALLLWRGEGPVAAMVGAVVMAIAPEAIFRTTMMAPTALDLALVPFLLYAILELMQGKLAWIGVAAPLAFFLLYAHPWLFTILTLAGLAFIVFAIALPWPVTRGQKLSAEGLVASIAIIGVCWGLSFNGCFTGCGSGFRDVVTDGKMLAPLAPLIIGISLLPAAIIAFAPRSFNWIVPHNSDRLRPLAVRLVLSALFLGAFVFVTRPAFEQGMPPFVNLNHMFGNPSLWLGAAGFVLIPFAASPAAHMGGAVALTTYPFVIYNPLHSPFWSHRTAVYLGIGLVILCGVAARTLAYGATQLFFYTRAWIDRRQHRPATAARPLYAALIALLVAGAMAQSVYAYSPPPRQNWYRLYDACQFDALQNVSATADLEPDAIVVTGAWQSKLVIAALADNASRVWFKNDFFTDPEKANRLPFEMQAPFYAVVDPELKKSTPSADTEFLQHAPWHLHASGCPDKDGNQTIEVYTV
jgi:hypothetical protein